MSANKHKGAYDELRSKDPTLKLIIGGEKPGTYHTPFADIDFTSDNDIPNIRMVKILMGKVVDAGVIPAGTAIPAFIDASLYPEANINSEVILKIIFINPATNLPTGDLVRVYDIPAPEQDSVGDGTGDFTGWKIYGHDDGTGHFKEDTYVRLTRTVTVEGGTISLSNFLYNQSFVAPVIDGVNTSFLLPDTPYPGSVRIYRRGQRQQNGVDYTIAGNVVTYLYPPDIGDDLIIDFNVA